MHLVLFMHFLDRIFLVLDLFRLDIDLLLQIGLQIDLIHQNRLRLLQLHNNPLIFLILHRQFIELLLQTGVLLLQLEKLAALLLVLLLQILDLAEEKVLFPAVRGGGEAGLFARRGRRGVRVALAVFFFVFGVFFRFVGVREVGVLFGGVVVAFFLVLIPDLENRGLGGLDDMDHLLLLVLFELENALDELVFLRGLEKDAHDHDHKLIKIRLRALLLIHLNILFRNRLFPQHL